MPILLRKAEAATADRLAASALDCSRTYVSLPALLQLISKTSGLYCCNSICRQTVLFKAGSFRQCFGDDFHSGPSRQKQPSQLCEWRLVCAICTLDGPRGIECWWDTRQIFSHSPVAVPQVLEEISRDLGQVAAILSFEITKTIPLKPRLRRIAVHRV